jgi:hypothetical protein
MQLWELFNMQLLVFWIKKNLLLWTKMQQTKQQEQHKWKDKKCNRI